MGMVAAGKFKRSKCRLQRLTFREVALALFPAPVFAPILAKF
jgi:hypothetical protein